MFIKKLLSMMIAICGILFILLLLAKVSLAETKLGTGVFPNAQTIEINLIRGISTRSDVQKLLGIPTGAGGAMLPGYGVNSENVEQYEVWYYEDIEVVKFKSGSGFMVMDIRQQIILIFFKGEKFYGYFYSTNQ